MNMGCQIIHDSIPVRPGWSQEFLLIEEGNGVGYGSLAVGGPWKDKPTLYEFFVLNPHRSRVLDLFECLLATSEAVMIETQSNDVLLTVMLHAFARDVSSESILFHDQLTTSHAPRDAVFRRSTAEDAAQMVHERLPADAK
jgi:hypothetical protein